MKKLLNYTKGLKTNRDFVDNSVKKQMAYENRVICFKFI